MSSILTSSNRSVKLFTLKNHFLITAKVLHSIRMCLTVQVVWQVKHCGCGSCYKMKEWVSLVWPIRNRDITTCSLLDFLDAGLHSSKVCWILKSLLWMLLLHCCCHFVWRNLLIVGFRSVYGILDLSGVRSKANLAAESALSLPLTLPYYKSRAAGVTSEVGLTIDRYLWELFVLKKHDFFYTSTIPEVTWNGPLYNS